MGVKYIQAIKNNVMPWTMSRMKTPSDASSQAPPNVAIICGITSNGRNKIVACTSRRRMAMAITNAAVPNI